MRFVKTPEIAKKVFKKFEWNVNYKEKDIYLSFDDGPTPEITPWVLKTLELYNAKATFFCVGRSVEKYSSIYNDILEQGHEVGNHTYSHLNGWKTKTEEYVNDVRLAQKLIGSNLFRPPYGKLKPSQQKELSKEFRIVLWDVMSWDYHSKVSKEKCWDNVNSKTKRGNVVLFHDSLKAKENLFYTLPLLLEQFGQKGYCFKAIK